jgi:hypothetical protein
MHGGSLACEGLLHTIWLACTMPLLMKPRAMASAIWPHPMKPILLSTTIFVLEVAERGSKEKRKK